MKWTPKYSKKTHALFDKFNKKYDKLVEEIYKINKKASSKFDEIMWEMAELEYINENNFENYVHSVLKYLSKNNPELKKLVDESKVIDVEDEIKWVDKLIEVEDIISDKRAKLLKGFRDFPIIIRLKKYDLELLKKKGEKAVIDKYTKGLIEIKKKYGKQT